MHTASVVVFAVITASAFQEPPLEFNFATLPLIRQQMMDQLINNTG